MNIVIKMLAMMGYHQGDPYDPWGTINQSHTKGQQNYKQKDQVQVTDNPPHPQGSLTGRVAAVKSFVVVLYSS